MNPRNDTDLQALLEAVRTGELDVAAAAQRLSGIAALPFACLDLDRPRRRGMPEVIYGSGKTAEQIAALMERLNAVGQNAFATRISPKKAADVQGRLPDCQYHAEARALTRDVAPLPAPRGSVCVVCAGTTDLPVSAEAALTAQRLGADVTQLSDVGVAGLHRLMRHLDRLEAADVVVAVAGMEGALPSVIGGLINRPLIAVPTSVGYGAGAGGVAALLAMLNSCAPGITVVNIDNGFGAGVAAATIARQSRGQGVRR